MTRSNRSGTRPDPRKNRLFAAVTIAFPILVVVLLELALRWFHYGRDVSLFEEHEIRRQTYALLNPGIGSRYFGTSHFTPATAPDYFRVPKGEGVCRIFCLGGSTTIGFPYLSNGAFPSFLRDRLSATYPRKRFEVINLGMTAVNSFTVRDIIRELPAYQPDLVIVYDGHNEFYGALGVASGQTFGPSRFLTLVYLRMIHFRTFQLLRDGFQKLVGLFGQAGESTSRGTMMETLARGRYVLPGSTLYEDAYRNFRDNLLDIRNFCRSAGVPLILGTQVSDLRDQPPFVSEHAPSLTPERQVQFKRLSDEGARLQSQGSWDSAAACFGGALALDSLYADTHYRLAQCLERMGGRREALSEYIRARDDDALRFRTDSRFNDLIRSMRDSAGCYVADIEAAFMAQSPDALVGHNLITEHLHPTARGQFIIAEDYEHTMRDHNLLGTGIGGEASGPGFEESLWRQRSLTELDEKIAAQNVALLTSGWPFTSQLPHPPEIPSSDTLGRIAQEVVMVRLNWRQGHDEAIRYYELRREWAAVEAEQRTLLNQEPLDLQLYLDLARTCLREKRFDEMKTVLIRSLDVFPTLQAYRTLGDILMQEGDPAGALKYYGRMDDFAQDADERLQNICALSYAYAEAGRFENAKTKLLEALRENPKYQPALQLLAEVNRRAAASGGNK